MANEPEAVMWIGDIVEQLTEVIELLPTLNERNDIGQARQYCAHCLRQLKYENGIPSEAS